MTYPIDDATRTELSRFAFDEALLARFAARAGETSSNEVQGHIEPTSGSDVTLLPPAGSAARAALERAGRAALNAGEVGAVILAGGMATRFGGVVKAAVPVLQGRSFLDLKTADLRGGALPIFVMTSFATHDRIVEQVKTERLDGLACFPQCVSLRLTPEGTLFREADGTLSPYATGHGDLTFALRASGLLRRFREGGGKLLYVSNVDNLGATLDAAILGAHLASGAAITAEVVRKEKGDKGGAAARLDGRPQIVEAFRFPKDFDQDAIPLFNTNSFVLDAEAIDRPFELTYFRVEKKVEGRSAIQFERLVGELTAFLPTHFVEVPRGGPDGRFQPMKDPDEMRARLPEIEGILRARGVVRDEERPAGAACYRGRVARTATEERTTSETRIRVVIGVDGTGQHRVKTPIGFLTHMVEQLARHGSFDLEIDAEGDVHIDGHHTTEDLGFTLGKALASALGDKRGIRRYGWATLPMDEACVTCALDLSGRPFFVWQVPIPKSRIGDFDTELAEVFFEGFARGAQMNLHFHLLSGENLHHVIEICFKAFARALRAATEVDPRQAGIPSTKGTLTE